MDELIRKQDAIEAINVWLYCDKDERMPADVIKALPPVQSDVPVINVGDMISRQAAIDLLKQMRKDGDMVPWEGKDVFARIRKLPSVQPTITHEQAIDYLHETGWLQNHDRILTESKMMMPVQPIIYCEKCLYKKICSWKNQGAEFCSFGERGKQDDNPRTYKHSD